MRARHTARGRRARRRSGTGHGPARRPLPCRAARRDRRPRAAAAARPAPSVAVRGQGRRHEPELLAAGRPAPAAPRVAAGRTGAGGDPAAAGRVADPAARRGRRARRQAERPAARSYRSLVAASDVLEQLLAELGSPLDGGLHTLGHHERVRHRRAPRTARPRVPPHRARPPGRRRPFRGRPPRRPGCGPERMTVHALENCRTGRVRWHHDTGVLVAELLFDTRLRAGDTFLFRYARRGRHGGGVPRVRPRVRFAGRPVRAPGALRRGRAARALPPLRPALPGGAPQWPPGTRPQRPPRLGAPGRAAGAVGNRGDRVGLGVSGVRLGR